MEKLPGHKIPLIIIHEGLINGSRPLREIKIVKDQIPSEHPLVEKVMEGIQKISHSLPVI